MKQPSDIRTKLLADLNRVAWDALVTHAESGRLVLVATGTDLIDVAMAVAEDRASDIEKFMEQGTLSKPNAEAIAALSAQQDQQFDFVIVQPFVLAQPVPPHPENQKQEDSSLG